MSVEHRSVSTSLQRCQVVTDFQEDKNHMANIEERNCYLGIPKSIT